MATVPSGLSEQFSIGRVFGNSFTVIMRNPLLYLGIAALLSGVPALLMQLTLKQPSFTEALSGAAVAPPNFGAVGGAALLSLILSSLLQVALTRATIQDLNGQRPDFGDCLKAAASLFLPVIAISILVSIGAGLGMILLIVPGIILWLGWSVAIPVLVQERLGVFGSMSRSRALTKGSRWALFGLYIILIVAIWVVQAAVGILAAMTGGIVAAFLMAIVSTIFAMVMSSAAAASYIELRMTREGTGIDELAEIFA